MCLSVLHTSTPEELSAVADTHTEHSQLPHVHVNSHTCRSAVLYYTVLPLYTRRLILKRNRVLRLYTSKIVSDILTKAKQTLFHYSKLHHKRSLLLQQQLLILLLLLLLLLLYYYYCYYYYTFWTYEYFVVF